MYYHWASSDHKCVRGRARASAAGRFAGSAHAREEGVSEGGLPEGHPRENMPAGWSWSLLFHEGDMLGTLGAGLGDCFLFWILLPFTTGRLLCIPQNLQPCRPLLQRTGWGGLELSQEPRVVRLLCHRALLLFSLSVPLSVPILQKRKLSLRKGKCHIVHPSSWHADGHQRQSESSALGLLTESGSRAGSC